MPKLVLIRGLPGSGKSTMAEALCYSPDWVHLETDQFWMHRGSIHFHGHLHGNDNGMPGSRALDVGFDATGRVVSDMDQMIETALKGHIRTHHQKGL